MPGAVCQSYPVRWTGDGWLYLINNHAQLTDEGEFRLELWRVRMPAGKPDFVASIPEDCARFPCRAKLMAVPAATTLGNRTWWSRAGSIVSRRSALLLASFSVQFVDSTGHVLHRRFLTFIRVR